MERMTAPVVAFGRVLVVACLPAWVSLAGVGGWLFADWDDQRGWALLVVLMAVAVSGTVVAQIGHGRDEMVRLLVDAILDDDKKDAPTARPAPDRPRSLHRVV